MAKKAVTNRVHQLAKKLGVGSKDIVAKCESEGIPDITNHMSAVSAGLAATISEWFSEGGESSSAIETAQKVNISEVKARAKKKTREFVLLLREILGTIRSQSRNSGHK